MNEIKRIGADIRETVDRIHTTDTMTRRAWRHLKAQHGWALLLTLGAAAGVAGWWHQRRHRSAVDDIGQTAPATSRSSSEGPRVSATWQAALLATLPWVLSRVPMQLMPPVVRILAVHPLMQSVIVPWLVRRARSMKKGAR